MSETTTVDETSGELPELVESERLGADGTADDTPLKTRALLPFLVPLLSIAIVAVLVLNISRVFLADNKNTALAMAIIITLAILIGASLIAAAPRLKTSSLAVILGLVFVGVSLGGLASLGHSLDEGEAAAGNPNVNPPGAVKGTVGVVAFSTLKFNATEFTAPAGKVEFDYSGATGHTLAIQDAAFDGFLLTTDAGGPKKGSALLKAGQKYTIYCTVPGHEAAGMKATVTVS
ncbi:MAG TPA: plastocyanin/azurin family copper-binding protein [Acidimicrobiia bacterium]|jgi:plastocyanin